MKTLLTLVCLCLGMSAYAADCQMFLPHQEKITIHEERSCHVLVNRSVVDLDFSGACMALMTDSRGRKMVRVVVEGTRYDRFHTPELIITERYLSTGGEGKIDFFNRYTDMKNYNTVDILTSISTNHQKMSLKLDQGLLKVKPKYDFDFECYL